MSFLKKAMSSIGIGAAKVDTILYNDQVQAGQEVKGHVQIKGGNVEQRIDQIYLQVMTNYVKETDDGTVTNSVCIQKVGIPINATIQKGQEAQVPFSFYLTPKAPVTYNHLPVWIHTGLDIKMAVDPTDKDHLQVQAHPYTQVMLTVLQHLGFTLRKVKNEYARFDRELPFIQNFEFVPQSGEFRGRLDELEVAVSVEQGQLRALFEIDRKARGLRGFLSEAMDMDESKVIFTLTEQEMQQGENYIVNKIVNFIRHYS